MLVAAASFRAIIQLAYVASHEVLVKTKTCKIDVTTSAWVLTCDNTVVLCLRQLANCV